MTAITVVGGTGYAGSAIAREAASRGHEVTVLSRENPGEPIEGVRYVEAPVSDTTQLAAAVQGADVVVGALSPRGDMVGKLLAAYTELGNFAVEAQARFVVLGGFSSLRAAADQPRFVDAGGVPPEFEAEARELTDVLDWLATTPEGLDWLFVSPAQMFGGFNPGEARGVYRVAGTVALFDDEGKSDISGADYALAIVDEIDATKHHREQISFAY